jgi:hypothetical protein
MLPMRASRMRVWHAAQAGVPALARIPEGQSEPEPERIDPSRSEAELGLKYRCVLLLLHPAAAPYCCTLLLHPAAAPCCCTLLLRHMPMCCARSGASRRRPLSETLPDMAVALIDLGLAVPAGAVGGSAA